MLSSRRTQSNFLYLRRTPSEQQREPVVGRKTSDHVPCDFKHKALEPYWGIPSWRIQSHEAVDYNHTPFAYIYSGLNESKGTNTFLLSWSTWKVLH